MQPCLWEQGLWTQPGMYSYIFIRPHDQKLFFHFCGFGNLSDLRCKWENLMKRNLQEPQRERGGSSQSLQWGSLFVNIVIFKSYHYLYQLCHHHNHCYCYDHDDHDHLQPSNSLQQHDWEASLANRNSPVVCIKHWFDYSNHYNHICHAIQSRKSIIIQKKSLLFFFLNYQ